MKKLTILLFALCTMLLTSCHKEEEIVPPSGHAVLMYFPWADNLYSCFIDNIDDVKSAIAAGKGATGTRVLVLLATGSSKGQLSELVYNDGKCEERQLKTYTNWSFSNKENIKHMLNDMAVYANAETYSMIIGSHGSGWLPKECQPNKVRAFGGLTVDTKTNVETLDSAIVESSIKHLDYLCFDDCYMANIETAYCLRNATDYLIASTSEIMDHGMPYGDIWSYMTSTTPDYQSIVGGYHSFYTSYRFPYGALSVTDCSQMEYAATAMKELNVMMSEYGIVPTDITPQRLDGISYTVFFDMKDYTDKALAALQEKGANTSSLAINGLYDNIIVAHSCTPYLYSEYLSSYSGNKTFSVATNCGITISDPSRNSNAASYIENTAWYKATH